MDGHEAVGLQEEDDDEDEDERKTSEAEDWIALVLWYESVVFTSRICTYVRMCVF